MRLPVDLTRDQLGALAKLGEKRGCSRAALVREAVAGYLDKHQPARLDESFGFWRTSADEPEDGAAYQRRQRGEWR